MTGRRQFSQLEVQLEHLNKRIKQHKDDFALPKNEADLLVSCYEELRRLFREVNAESGRRYAEECHDYYSRETITGFFNDDEAGREIFAEIATIYQKIAEMKA